MDAFQFRRLSSAPDVGDQIAVYAAGTQNLISDLVDLDGQPLANPFVVGDADHWGFRPGVSSTVDVWWVDGGVYLARGELMESAAYLVYTHEAFVQHGTTAQEQISIAASEMHAGSLHAPAGAEANPDAGSQAQAEDNTGTTVYGWTGQRLYQAAVKWASLAASVFSGVFSGTATNYREGLYAAATSGNVAVSLANGNVQRFVLDAARQFTMPASPGAVGASFVLILNCAGFTPTWNTAPTIKWLTSDGAAPTLNTTSGKLNVITFVWDNTTSSWLGFFGGKET